MAAKGTIAKDNVIKKIQSVFGSDYVGVVDKKVYVWAEENGEKIQVAISLTCPKVPVGAPAASESFEAASSNNVLDFENMTSVISKPEPAIITEQEKENIAAIMERLGL